MSRRRVLKTSIALEDIKGHVDFIASDNPDAARNFLSELTRTFESLASMPMMGTLRFSQIEQLAAVRSFVMAKPFTSFVILYQPLDDGIQISRVLHNAMDKSVPSLVESQ